MFCLNCNSTEFAPKADAVLEQEFRGEVLKVQTPALACVKCGWVTMDLAHADELRCRTADAYRHNHGLLTSDQIRSYREKLCMSQREFAAFLRVGEASVKRWETWQVQDASSDELIRVKCEQELKKRAELNAPTVWYSFSTHWNTFSTDSGITVEQAPAPAHIAPSRWEVSEQDRRQLKVFDDVADEALALAA